MSTIARRLMLICAAMAPVALPAPVMSDEIPWSTDIEESLRQAAASGKPVMMEFTAPWCVYCKRMEKTTFEDPEVVACVNKNFVAVRVDADQNKALVTDLAIKGLPAILIVSPELKIIQRISGFQTPAALIAKLDNVPPGDSKAADIKSIAAAQKRDAAAAPKSRPGELEFEAITHEEASPQRQDNSLRSVSKPRVFNPDPPTDAAAESATADETNSFFDALTSAEAVGSAPGKVVAPAFGGKCLVSAVEDREIVDGSAEVTTSYRGKALHFRSEQHMRKFLANPTKYWPMLDGVCAMTLLNEDQSVEGELQYAAVFRKRIWLFASEKEMTEFLKDPAEIAEEVAEQTETAGSR